jgi:hypothetical protein
MAIGLAIWVLPTGASGHPGRPRLPGPPSACQVPVELPGAVCPPPTRGPDPPATAQASAARLEQLIEEIPSLDSGRSAVGATDDQGGQLGAIDPIDDPAGGYLAVYHSPYRPAFGRTFKISLAHSNDLLHWTRLRVLDGIGASMPTLRPIPGTTGYLLAYEKQRPRGDLIRVAYFRSGADLLAGRASTQRDLPRRLSHYNNGTPSILSIDWRGSVHRSLIELAFHYQTEAGRRAAADREAIGWLRDFRVWQAHKDSGVDQALSARQLDGSHGDWRQFAFQGFRWRIYEGQSHFDSFRSWHIVLYDASSRATYPLALQLGDSRITSVGNPIVRSAIAPSGVGKVLVITTFVFSASSPGLTGELVYYQPV